MALDPKKLQLANQLANQLLAKVRHAEIPDIATAAFIIAATCVAIRWEQQEEFRRSVETSLIQFNHHEMTKEEPEESEDAKPTIH